jgi:hypothetical protein
MNWRPIAEAELRDLLVRELAECTDAQREFFGRVRIDPAKWALSPWGDLGEGFWAVAVHESRVLWFNDIEVGFNVSSFTDHGRIPDDEYWCNPDSLCLTIHLLQGSPGIRLGPPQRVGGRSRHVGRLS